MPANSTDPSLRAGTTGDLSMQMAVDVRRFPWIRRLAADYAYDFPAVAPFFSGDPTDQAAWTQAIARAQAHDRRRPELAAALAAQQRRRGAPARAREAAENLADSRTVAIVTGHQAGLFGGPLFTLFKAITVLKLADEVSRSHHVPVVAVFWIDSEDHDWDEVRACKVFDQSLTPRTVELPTRTGTDPTPVAALHLDKSILGTLQDLESVLPPTEFHSQLMANLREVYTPGVGMADAFGRWLERLLGDRGLVVHDAADMASKPLARSVFARELSMPGETLRLAAIAGADLVAHGYHAQVRHSHDDSLALFHLDGGRRSIRQQDGEFVVGDRHYARAALLQQASDRPAGFSPNVLLRPIVQDAMFPTICYVAGPNELAYLGQLRLVYDHFGVPMPLMYPRASATLLDSAAVRFLNKSGVRLETLQPQDEGALNALLESQMPAAIEQSLAGAAVAIDAQMTQVIEAMSALDPTLEGAAKSTIGRMRHDLEALRRKAIQAAKRRDETLRRQYLRTRGLVFPDGQPQERAIGFISFLNQYGPALVERLSEALPLDFRQHWILAV